MSEDLVKRRLAQYLLLGQDIKRLQEQQKDVKAQLDPYLDQAETNARGSYVIPFTDSLQIGETRYKAVQRVRKESKVLNEERVIEFLDAKQNSEDEDDIYWDDLISNSNIYEYIRHVNQDVLWEWFVNDYISEEELNSFFDVTESYAFLPTKE